MTMVAEVTSITDILQKIFTLFAGSTTIVGVVVFVFWKADDLISKRGTELLDKMINQSINDPERSELRGVLMVFLRRYFSSHLPALTFIANVALLTISSMIILLIVYLSKTGGFFTQLSSDPNALQLFLRQFFFNGFIVTYMVNHIAFSIYSYLIDRVDLNLPKLSAPIIVLDVFGKIVIFILATMASYIVFAALFGSFEGDYIVAVQRTLPTIAQALRFENLSAVYLYSVAISSLPIFVISLINLLVASRSLASFVRMLFFWLPFDGRPMRSFAAVLGIFGVVFYQLSNAVVSLVV